MCIRDSSRPDSRPSTRRRPHRASSVREIASSGSSASTSTLSFPSPLSLSSSISPSSRPRSIVRSFDRSFNSLPNLLVSRDRDRVDRVRRTTPRGRERRRVRERTASTRVRFDARARRQTAASNDHACMHVMHFTHPRVPRRSSSIVHIRLFFGHAVP